MPSKPKFGPRKPDPLAVESFVSEGAQALRPPDRQTSKRPGARAAARSRSIIERKGGRLRRRMTVYLPPELAQDLEILAVQERADLSDLIEEGARAVVARAKKPGRAS